MLIGAMIDLGVELPAVQAMVDAVLPNTVRLTASQVQRAGMRSCKVDVKVLVEDHQHRRWGDIRAMIERADIPGPIRTAALDAFLALALAEARVHGVVAEEVRFHEVGAWDSIADIVGACAGLHLLGISSVSASSIALGSGRVRAAHGDMAVPAPAVLELSVGWEVFTGGSGELATPTGLALIRTLADTCETLPAMQVQAIGIGAGTKDPPDRANVVRIVVGVPAGTPSSAAPARLRVLEANVDDLDSRVWPDVLARLMDAGAADAWLTPILMKKGRPAHTLSVLCHDGDQDRLRDLVFTHTSTFGIREYAVDRAALQREWRPVTVAGTVVRIKISLDAHGRIRHATPEFDDATAAARAAGLPLRQVLDAARWAAEAAGLTTGATVARATDAPA